MTRERDYVLGTHDDEIQRLGVQHDVWRPCAKDAWKRAGFAPGQKILDVGAGPGYATMDLAELVGPKGRVVAVDRSRRFLDVLESRKREHGFENIDTVESDLDEAAFDPDIADGAWCRWVLAFVHHPHDLLSRVAKAIKPGGAFVSHEYFDYASWRSLPPSKPFSDFVAFTMSGWRNSGGEPDIGLHVPPWLEELGYTIESVKPMIYVITPEDRIWKWPTSFMEVGLERLHALGVIEEPRASEMREAMHEIASSPHSRMITPGVLEVVARRR